MQDGWVEVIENGCFPCKERLFTQAAVPSSHFDSLSTSQL